MNIFSLLTISPIIFLSVLALRSDLRRGVQSVSTNGRCGSFFNGQTCLGSKYGNSCGLLGFCGPQQDILFSGLGCQSTYGLCGYKPPTGVSISKDGRCGKVNGETWTCLGSNFGVCCSRDGKCGNGAKYCLGGGCVGYPGSGVTGVTSVGSATATTAGLASTSSSKAAGGCKPKSSPSISSTVITSSSTSTTSTVSISISTTTSSSTSISTTTSASSTSTSSSTPPTSTVSSTSLTTSSESTTTISAAPTCYVSVPIQYCSALRGQQQCQSYTSMGATTFPITYQECLADFDLATCNTYPNSCTSSTSSSIVSTTSQTSSSSAVPSSTTSTTSTSSSIASSPTQPPASYTPGVAVPTHTYTGGIAALPAGTAVAVSDPSFESAGIQKHKRQTSAQQAAAADGWVIDSCGDGTLTDCMYENYDAADGVWAFAAPSGGLIYQDGVKLSIGATYAFTFYWKVLANGPTDTASSTDALIQQGVYLGNTNTAASAVPNGPVAPVGSARVASGGDWAEQTFTVTLSCQYANFGVIQSDGTVAFRMFIDAFQAGSVPFTWYVDEIRVQQTNAAATNYLTSTCKATIPVSSTASATTTFIVSETFAPTATPLVLQQDNFLTDPSFESLTIVQSTDVNGYPTRATGWTSTGCQSRNCRLSDNLNGGYAEAGRYSEEWISPTTYSQTISNIPIGFTYGLSMYTMLTGVTTSNTGGSSIVTWTLEPAGSTPGSGAVVLQVTMTQNQGWTFYQDELYLDVALASAFCSGGAPDGQTTCQLTISGSYGGGWSAATGVTNYFDNVAFNQTYDEIQGAG